MNEYVLTINQKEYRAEVSEINAEFALIQVNGREFRVGLQQLALSKLMPVEIKKSEARPEAAAAIPAARPTLEPPPAGGDVSNIVKSPLPGLIVDVKVGEGEKVKAGQIIVVMEAMKMENQIQATIDGTVKKIFVKKGDNVAEGDTLIEIARSDMASL
jgi:glutaconyl-CoA/methylmalonyl-CoA decarboxylase subunit gamma